MSRIGEFLQIEYRWVADRGDEGEMMSDECGGLCWSNKNILKLSNVVIAAQFCEQTKSTDCVNG
jgi:hypothetical protein